MNHCPVCSAEFEGMVCPSCGYTLPDSCPNEVTVEQKEPVVRKSYRGISSKNKLVVLLLCIFLGIFGVHRFYVGKVGTGVFFLLTLGVCGLGWISDIFNICIGNFSDQVGHFVQE